MAADMNKRAFPVEEIGEFGMSLRDWFAGMALQAIDIQTAVAPPAAGHLARSAYEIADAMMKRREET